MGKERKGKKMSNVGIVETCETLLNGNNSVVLNISPELSKLCTSSAKIEAISAGYVIQQNIREKTISIRRFKTPTANAGTSAPVNRPSIEKPDPNVPFSNYYAPGVIDDILSVLRSDKTVNIWLYGPTQSGKTTAVRYIGYKLGRKIEPINCKGDMDSHHFFGHNTIVNGNIVFQKGAVERSMTEGLDEKGNIIGEPGILFIDEAAAMPTEIGIGLNNTLETGNNVRILTLPEDGNRVVKSHPGWRVILAGNNNGTGASSMESQMYTAQQCSLDASQIQRISMTVRFGYDRRAEERIVRIGCDDDQDIVPVFLQFKQGVRDALKRKELITPFSTKRVIDIFDLYRVFVGKLAGSSISSKKLALGKAIYYAAYEMLTDEEKKKYDELWYPLAKEVIGRWSPAMNTSAETDYI